jgi:hypothetical protein
MPRAPKTIAVFTEKEIARRIYTLREQKIMLDQDLAELYGTQTKNLNKAVLRNAKRFPADFMFKLTFQEFSGLRFQNGTSKKGGRRYLPQAFTENGVAMLSSVLNSERAIQVNIQIMRIFTHTRGIMINAKSIQEQVNILQNQSLGHKQRIDVAFDAIHFLLNEEIGKKKIK